MYDVTEDHYCSEAFPIIIRVDNKRMSIINKSSC